jgi:nucleotide-binding universal stress UspA family protein
MFKAKTLVIGTSLTPESDRVVAVGAQVSRACGAKVRLVHAYPPLPGYSGLPTGLGTGDAAWIAAQRGSLVERIAAQARAAGLPDGSAAMETSELLPGSAHQALVDVATREQADLIVVGASEARAGRLRPLSTTADRVVRKAPAAVFVVRPESAFPPRRVLLPVDLSSVSAGALRFGLALLAEAGLSEVESEVLFVLNPLEVEGSLQFTPAQITRFAADELERFVAANAPGSRLRRRVRTGYAWEQIIAEIEELQADLTIMGTHGHSAVERLIIGSVTTDVLREAPSSVLVVPPEVAHREVAPFLEEADKSADWTYVADETPA